MKRLITLLSLLPLAACSREESLNIPHSPAAPPTVEGNRIEITVGAARFSATLAGSATSDAFKSLLPLTLSMGELNDNEKYAGLPQSLPTAAVSTGTIRNGDIMLFGASTLVLFYQSFTTSYSYTPIGTIDHPAGLQQALGAGNVSVRFELK